MSPTMELSATLRSADSLFRLTPEDYISEFPALIPLLEKQWGKNFLSATLVTRLPNGLVKVNSDNFLAVPTKVAFADPKWVAQITVNTSLRYGAIPLTYGYSIDGLMVAPWSAPIGRGPVKEWIGLVRAKKYLREAERRIAPIKEELMAAAWSPKRIERLLEAGGPEALDAL